MQGGNSMWLGGLRVSCVLCRMLHSKYLSYLWQIFSKAYGGGIFER